MRKTIFGKEGVGRSFCQAVLFTGVLGTCILEVGCEENSYFGVGKFLC